RHRPGAPARPGGCTSSWVEERVHIMHEFVSICNGHVQRGHALPPPSVPSSSTFNPRSWAQIAAGLGVDDHVDDATRRRICSTPARRKARRYGQAIRAAVAALVEEELRRRLSGEEVYSLLAAGVPVEFAERLLRRSV